MNSAFLCVGRNCAHLTLLVNLLLWLCLTCVQNVLIGGRIYDLTAFNVLLSLITGCFTNCTKSAWC